MIDGAAWHGSAGHLLQTESLSTELQVVMLAAAPAAVLVLDGIRRVAVVLDDISLADKAEAVGPDG